MAAFDRIANLCKGKIQYRTLRLTKEWEHSTQFVKEVGKLINARNSKTRQLKGPENFSSAPTQVYNHVDL